MEVMDCLDENLGMAAICVTGAVGDSPREGASFATAQAQMDKLSNIHAQSCVDWEVVAASCVKILREEGKDLTVAVWLVCAGTSLAGVSGLVSAVRMLRGLLEQHWPVFSPPLVRLRARRNQIEWLLDWLDLKLNDAFEPVMAGQHAQLLKDWNAIDAFWSEQDSQAPAFVRLRRRLADLPVQAATLSPLSPAPAESADTPVCTEPAPTIVAVSEPKALSVDTIDQVVDERFAAFRPLIEMHLQSPTMQPLLLRVNRLRAWFTLEVAPPSLDGTTRVPPPPAVQVENFAQVLRCGEPLDIVRFCEERLTVYPYWLDLNRASHAALSCMGAQGSPAATSVALECRHLLARMPTLAGLTFADGQPFANSATRSWFESLAPVIRCADNVDAIQALIDAAEHDAMEGRLSDALRSLQVHVETIGGGRDRFRLRHAQCDLLHRFDPRVCLRVALEVLLQEAQALALDRWEPELLRPLLELVLEINEDARTSVWGKQLAAMDLLAFWRLAGSQGPNS